jgi:hypothetical protein
VRDRKKIIFQGGKMKLLIVLLFMACTMQFSHASADRRLNGKYIDNGAYTLTVPSITDTLTTITGSATLTNKTMAGNVNTFSLIPVGAIGNGSVLSGSNTGDVTVGAFGSTPNDYGFSLSTQALSLQPADATHPGALSAADWGTFNGKMANPMSAVGDTIYGGTAGAATKLTGNITITKEFLSQTGDGEASAAPVWSAVSATDVGLGSVTNDAQVKKSEYAAKGNILIGTGTGTYSAVGVGTNGQILTAASGEASGVQWAAAPVVAPTITGTRAAPTAITAAGGITFTGTNYNNIAFIAGDAAPIVVTANPQIAAATSVGQKLTIIGRDATNTVTIADSNGTSLNGSWVAGLDSVLELVWDGSVWVEMNRR